MISSRYSRFMAPVLGLALAWAGGAKADMITILNAGFEDPPLSDGTFTRAAPPGWILTGDGGSYNPPAISFPGGVPEGQNTAWLHSGRLAQTLAELLQPGVYTLRVDIGDGATTRFPGYAVELLAGTAVLAVDNNTLAPPDGTFLTSTLVFTATTGDANLGQPLGIRLSSSGEETNFDNVRLDFTPAAVPEPSSAVMLVTGAVGFWRYARRRGRNHLSSGTPTRLRKSRKRATAVLLAVLALGASATTRADLVVASFTGGPTTVGHGGNSSTTLGWTFTANSNVLVTALGYYDDGANGLQEAHDVGIFDSGGGLLVSATVPSGSGGSLVDRFRYVSIAPFALAAGTYTIGGTIGANATDPVAYNVSGLSSIPVITIPPGASRYTEAGSYTSLSFPNLSYPPGNPYNAYFGPNFQISAVPEPASLIMLGMGGLGLLGYGRLRRWNDQGSRLRMN